MGFRSGTDPQTGTNRSATEDLGFVLDYGKQDWNEVALALREFVSNAIDRSIREHMTIRAAVVRSSGRTTIKQLVGWKGIQAEIGGAFLELVPLSGEFACYVDENGIAKGLSRNQKATEIVERALAKVGRSFLPGDFIKGTAVFVGRKVVDDPEARFWDVPPEDVQQVGVDDDLPQSVIDEFFPNARVETLPKAPAYVHANDYLFDTTFEANPWFEQASDEEIKELSSAGWTGSVAESVAHFAEDYNESVNVVLDYCLRKESQGKPVGFGSRFMVALLWPGFENIALIWSKDWEMTNESSRLSGDHRSTALAYDSSWQE